MSTTKGLEIAKAVKTFLASTKSFDRCLEKVSLISGGNGKMLAEFTVGPEHVNSRGTLHGGYVAMLVDCVSTYALRTNETVTHGGASVDLSVSYLNAAKEGDVIQVEANTVKAGKTLAFLAIELRNKDKNTIIATGKHTKFIA